ncbi:oxidoreductase [Brachybacterium endophyticum]|uniref:Oxidoreductase n=1 Tax=Brachybacterium endophyticum TaxID=2182385 RepID=A0A2U2RJM4_9MICO|nr:aldo/keto reductase [Brachybacterium endophyticum]PWH06060.1 oxidoreductase [Brachybacterium endophyticum]
MSTGHIGDFTVKRVGYGAMQLAGPGVFGPPADPENNRAVLRRALELGVDHIDTAQFYGPDVVNDLIREALHPYPENLRLVTKVGAERSEKGEFLPAGRPEQLVEQVEANLRALDTDRLTMVNLRRYELDAPGSEEPALEDQLAALVGLREQGKVAEIGVSSVSADTVRRAVDLAGVVSVQNPYSILDRSGQEALEVARDHDLAFVPYFPLGSAFTGGPAKIAADPHVTAVAQKHGVAPTQVALAWLLAQYENVLLIPGTSSIAHLEDNLAVADVQLDPEDLSQLGKVEESPVEI